MDRYDMTTAQEKALAKAASENRKLMDESVRLRAENERLRAEISVERQACRQECLDVLRESGNIAAGVCAGRIGRRSSAAALDAMAEDAERMGMEY